MDKTSKIPSKEERKGEGEDGQECGREAKVDVGKAEKREGYLGR